MLWLMPKEGIVDIHRYDAGHPVDGRIAGEQAGSAPPRDGGILQSTNSCRVTPVVRQRRPSVGGGRPRASGWGAIAVPGLESTLADS